MNFSLVVMCFGELSDIFVRALARKMLNFPLEVVIWWLLKMNFWEVVTIVNTFSEFWDW